MEYGIQIEPQFGYAFDEVVSIAKAAIKNGFSTVWFSDHFMLDKASTDRVLLDPWLVMASLIQMNKKVKVGSMVFSQSYRNPALTAKMAATLDVLSSGRLAFGIGAGWKEIEYKAYGYPFPSGKTRIDQLIDAVQIIRGIWTNEHFTYKGKYYQVENVIAFPKPVQDPMPIWIGASQGRDPILRVAAKYGDGINLAWAISPDFAQERFKRLTQMAQRAGRDASQIIKSVGLWTRYFKSETEIETAIQENAAERNISTDEYRKRVSVSLWGTPDQIIKRIQEFEQLDVSHLIFMFPHKQEIQHLNQFGKNVLPKV